MSDYHILDGGLDGNQLRVAFHLPVPDGNNKVGVNYRTALKECLPFTASVVPASRLGVGEQTALENGELYELVWSYDTQPGTLIANKRSELDAKFNLFASAVVDQLKIRLDYWGYGRDVA